MSASERLRAAYAGKRVLVTGNTGFKGSWLALWLSRLGAEVTGFSDAVQTEPSHFERLGLPYRTLFGDIADADAVAGAVAEARPDIVFHLAAQSLVRRSYTDPVATYRTNLIGSLTLFEACRAAGGVQAIVSATTDKVYRNKEWDWGYRETDELGGADPYSASKSCVEIMTESWLRSFGGSGETRIASVRAGNVIGGGDWAEDRLIPDIIRAAYGGETLSIRNPNSTRPWQHVLDPLAGYLLVGARTLDGGDIEGGWNFGPLAQRRVRVGEIVELLKERLPGLRVDYAPETAGRHESGLLELDSSKAANRLGWRPVWEGEMLERTLDWYRAFYEGGRLLSDEQLDDYQAALDRAG
ncbi:MAG: CDP-glucose 4,6-dehydratase [Allosphingosinicella sp.]|uniref:CDP-glucose 4,6-dehydratase n=1 Tax=Allosphingosinicella sp. TaxID=2823234 RepID=UPI00394382B4